VATPVSDVVVVQEDASLEDIADVIEPLVVFVDESIANTEGINMVPTRIKGNIFFIVVKLKINVMYYIHIVCFLRRVL
jgi:hypothetical protein